MNVIIAYLETMFSAYPQTARLQEAKGELQTMMEDAYSGFIAEGLSENEAVGRVITEFGNLDELAPVLGIAGEIAPGGARDAAAEAAPAAPRKAPQPAHPPVTRQEAEGFVDAHRRTRFRLSTAVALFVLSPAPLIVLPVAADTGAIPLAANVATVIGLVLLFALVATGVLLVIGLSREFAPYARLRENRFTRDPAVAGWAEGIAQQHERSRIVALQLAVLCWVLSPAPILLGSLLTQDSPLQALWSVIGVALTLVIVAGGLLILLPATWARSAADALEQGGSRSASEAEEERSVIGIVASVYWPLLTAVFLAWSFIGNAWQDSWIVWPIGAVLFGALAAGLGAWESFRKARA